MTKTPSKKRKLTLTTSKTSMLADDGRYNFLVLKLMFDYENVYKNRFIFQSTIHLILCIYVMLAFDESSRVVQQAL